VKKQHETLVEEMEMARKMAERADFGFCRIRVTVMLLWQVRFVVLGGPV